MGDKNTVTGFVLIFLIIVFFSWYNSPSPEQLEAQQRTADSIALAHKQEALKAQVQKDDIQRADSLCKANPDSARALFGGIAARLVGDDKEVVLQNQNVCIRIGCKGGVPSSAVLKNYQTYGKQPLELFNKKNASFALQLPCASRIYSTQDLYFSAANQSDTSVSMVLDAGAEGCLTFTYRLPKDGYMLGMDVSTRGLKGTAVPNEYTRLDWNAVIEQKEKSANFESRYSELSYKVYGDGVETISNTSDEEETVEEPLHWIAFKDQYFSWVLISPDGRGLKKAKLNSYMQDPGSNNVHKYAASIDLNLDLTKDQTTSYKFFCGPNQYKLLSSLDDGLHDDECMDLHKLIPLGWALFRWVNQLVIIPLFNLLGTFISNYGILILVLTIIIKLLIFPFTYKSYLSTAMMRVLKPEIEKMTANIPAENAAERQQVSMQVYSKAGVNPMGGCLPMLLQMPVLIAMFTFLPTAIELRGQSFLWAEDLSAYDSILELPFSIPFYGSHVSLFCLLMTVVNVVYTKFNMQMTDTGAQQQMPMMKYMMYMMPVMFLFFFNDYASGLTFYYFVSLLITILQTIGMRFLIDDDRLLKKIHEKAAARPANSMSWMQRMQALQEEAARQQQNRGK